jgi:multidrug efflux pump subunit AcrA (membrane-fusion protein)
MKRSRTPQRPLTLTLALAFILTACGKSDPESAKAGAAVKPVAPADVANVMGIALIEPGKRIAQLGQNQSGTVKEIFAAPGAQLKAGQDILTLDNSLEAAQVSQASARIGTQTDAIAAAEANTEVIRTRLEKAKTDLARNEKLKSGGAITQQAYDDSRAQVDQLAQELKASTAAAKQQRARANELRSDLNYYQTVLNQSTLKAPADGTLLSLDIHVGEYLDGRTSIGEFAPAGPLIALTEIDELYASQVQVGQKAYIRTQGKVDTLSTGTVVLASPYLRKKSLFSDNPANLEDRRVREVHVQLDKPEAVLIGARVECIIITQ